MNTSKIICLNTMNIFFICYMLLISIIKQSDKHSKSQSINRAYDGIESRMFSFAFLITCDKQFHITFYEIFRANKFTCTLSWKENII